MERSVLKKQIEDFMSDKDRAEKTASISVRLSDGTLADFHINADGRCIEEDSTNRILMISNMNEVGSWEIPDTLHICYEDVVDCKIGTFANNDDGTDAIADVLTLTYANGTEVEIGFLVI